MGKLAWVLVAVSGAALTAGCAMDRGSMAAKPRDASVVALASPCAGPANPVPITIGRIVAPATAASGSIQVNPGWRNIGDKATGVHWQLPGNVHGGPDYLFAGDGIVFKTGSPAGPGAAVPGGKDFWWCFNATPVASQWPYTIRFYEAATPSRIWSCDPIIANTDGSLAAMAPLPVGCTPGK